MFLGPRDVSFKDGIGCWNLGSRRVLYGTELTKEAKLLNLLWKSDPEYGWKLQNLVDYMPTVRGISNLFSKTELKIIKVPDWHSGKISSTGIP